MAPADPDTPDFGYDVVSPTPSPVMDVYTSFNFASPAPTNCGKADQSGHITTNMEDDGVYNQEYSIYDSSFSTLKGWAGDMAFKRTSPCVLGDLSFATSFSNEPVIMDTVVGDYGWPQAMYQESYRSTAEMPHLQHYSNGLDTFHINSTVGVV